MTDILVEIIEQPIQVVIESSESSIELDPEITVEINLPPPIEVFIDEAVEVDVIGIQGPQGPPGYGQSAVVGTGIAGTNISFLTVLVLVASQLYPADPTNLAHVGRVVGVSRQAALAGTSIEYVETGEIISATMLNDSKYFLGLAGALSTNQVAAGAIWMQAIGIGYDDADKFVVELEPPIVLS